MVTPVETLGWGLILLAGAGYVGTAASVHRHEEFPGRASFVASSLLIGGLQFGLVVLFAVSSLNDVGRLIGSLGIVALFSNYVTGLFAPLAWVRFGLQFTGQQVPTDRRTFLLLGSPVALAILANAVPVTATLLWAATGNEAFRAVPVELIMSVVRYITSLIILYLAALLIVGMSLIAWTSYTYRHLSTRASILLGLGIGLPWIAVAITEVTDIFDGQAVLGTTHVVLGSVVGVAAMARAVYSYDLFGNIPAAGTVGRETTVEEMNEPVLVVDLNHRLVDLNAAAERAFDASAETIGTPLETVFDGAVDPEELLEGASTGTTITIDHTTYQVTASELRDEYGRTLGYSVLLHDVTDRLRREQRIQVLNRVLRHNLRNDMNAINGYAGLLDERGPDSDEYAERIQELAADLLSIGEKARTVEELVATDGDEQSVPLSEVLERTIDELETAYPECSIRVDSAVDDVSVNGAVFRPVLQELVENGIEHNDADDPSVEIAVRRSAADSSITVQVTDNGPGIPDHELTPLRAETETALEHGSGLGLWLVKWGVRSLGGQIEFERVEPRGTVATLLFEPAGT